MAILNDFMPLILPYAQGCPAPMAELQLRLVCIDFCSHAPVVQVVLDPIDVIAGQAEYDIDTPFGTNVAFILDARYHGQGMAMAKTGDADYLPDLRAPYALYQCASNSFSLDRAAVQDDPGAIVLRVSTRPTRLANTFDDVLLNDYSDAIGAGVVARLMMMPGQTFSNAALAGSYQAMYITARTDARIRADKSFGQATTGVRPRAFR